MELKGELLLCEGNAGQVVGEIRRGSETRIAGHFAMQHSHGRPHSSQLRRGRGRRPLPRRNSRWAGELEGMKSSLTHRIRISTPLISVGIVGINTIQSRSGRCRRNRCQDVLGSRRVRQLRVESARLVGRASGPSRGRVIDICLSVKAILQNLNLQLAT